MTNNNIYNNTTSTPLTVEEQHLFSDELRRIVARHVDVVGWNGDTADCTCPGEAKYATIFLSDKVPKAEGASNDSHAGKNLNYAQPSSSR